MANDRLPLQEARRRVEKFLTQDMPSSLRTVEYRLAGFDEPNETGDLDSVARAEVDVRHISGASDARYRVRAFEDALTMQLQLNVWRLVVVYRVPVRDALDADGLRQRFERWRIGAEHAGWSFGWRDTIDVDDHRLRFVETYCYATAAQDFLEDELAQLYWKTDIVQMTRYFMLEARRFGISLSGEQMAGRHEGCK